jgi:hypothetical protein
VWDDEKKFRIHHKRKEPMWGFKQILEINKVVGGNRDGLEEASMKVIGWPPEVGS